jgi:rod shape-determining protein MreD
MLAVGRGALAPRRGLTAVTVLIAAAGAVVAALLEATLSPFIDIAGARPHLVFVVAIAWSTIGSIEGSLAWGFTGGLMLDVLAPRPLGTTALVLVLVVGVAALAARGLAPFRLRLATPVILAVPLSIANSLGVALVVAAVGEAAVPSNALSLLLPGAVFDTVLVALLMPIALAIRARQAEPDRVGW